MREDSITDHRKNIILLVFIVIAVGICKITVFLMVYADDPSRIFSPDSASYVNTARAFLKTGRFAISPDRPDIPQVVRTPGYPFFISSIFFLFGDSNTYYASFIYLRRTWDIPGTHKIDMDKTLLRG